MTPNNLDAVRLAAAFMVLYSHSFVFLGLPVPVFLSWTSLGTLGVFIFFTISGYLIAASWQRDGDVFRFLSKRALRIFPGLAVCVLLTAFVLGPMVSTLPPHDYFHNHVTWDYLRNIGLYIVYSLPGVFAGNHYPNAVNGSIWSLPVEFLMYLVVAFAGLLGGNRRVYAALALLSALLTVFWAESTTKMLVIYGFDLRQAFICGTYFWAGAVFQAFGLKRFFTLSAAVMGCIALISLEPWPQLLQIASWVLLPLVVLSFGFSHSPLLSRLTQHGDFSYGIYIYAFPVQQTVALLKPHASIGFYLASCTILTLLCGILSWHFVEIHALKLKPRSHARPAVVTDRTQENA